MKFKKLNFLTFLLIAVLSITACTANDPNINTRNRNLSTQTRPNTRWNQGDNRIDQKDTRMNEGEDLTPNRRTDNRDDLNQVEDNSRRNNFPEDSNLNDGMKRPDRKDPNTSPNLTNKSEIIAEKITDLPEVDKARVILTDETALVGCRLRGETQDTMTTSLKDKIEDIVEDQVDVKNISITTEPELYSRIETMYDKVVEGHPIEAFTDEFRDLINKITPNMDNRRKR